MTRFLDCSVAPEVVAQARAGSRAAQEEIYRIFGGPVYTTARRMCTQPDVADEILQETFVEVLRKLGDYRGDAPLGAWIRTIAVNKCLMYLRSAWRRYAVPVEPEVLERTLCVSDPTARAQTRADLEAALGTLSGQARAVVWLHDVEGYTHVEIGRLMGRSVSFSKSQLARAHKRLRRLLDAHDENRQCMQVLNNC